jgi:aspartokinase/homoserine dehydrogenase 1
MNILKFGGTSVGSHQALENVLDIISGEQAGSPLTIAVVSAFSGVTNILIALAKEAAEGDSGFPARCQALAQKHLEALDSFSAGGYEECRTFIHHEINALQNLLQGVFLLRECSPRSLDLILSFGERLSAAVVSSLLQARGFKASILDARELILTDLQFGSAHVDFSSTYAKMEAWSGDKNGIFIATGFIASGPNGETTTLGRGGSDYTAALFGAGLRADEIHIYTDVSGMMTSDPRMVPEARSIPLLSYQEAMELSHFGAKVIYPPTLQPAFNQAIPIRILNTFEPSHPGTCITDTGSAQGSAVTGLTSIRDIRLFNLQGSGLIGVAGFASRLFSALGKAKVNVILITQASSEHSISVAVAQAEAEAARIAMEHEFEAEFRHALVDPLEWEDEVSVLAVVGEHMKKAPGVSGKIFSTLGRNGINIRATAQGSSERNISTIIPTKDLAKALNALHQAFFDADLRKLYVFLAGPGLIGSTFLKQLAAQQEYLKTNLHLRIQLCGVINSRKMVLSSNGLDSETAIDILENSGFAANSTQFVEEVLKFNLPGSILVDCTSGTDWISVYPHLLENNIAVVTPNKRANSGPLAAYLHLKRMALKGNTRFLYETNVGAGLPIIQTLQNLIRSGDRIHRIEAMLSGTLSFIFNTFHSGISFRSVVEQAKELGYTEPDPRDDLSGSDMARKLLILARESGLPLEPADVVTENILPQPCLDAPDTQSFMETLDTHEDFFRNLALAAEKNGEKLKFLCCLENGSASIRLARIGQDHPFWNSSGADNILAFYTDRYAFRPMVIQGPGAGAEVTAAGVFGDVMSLV